MPTMRQQTATLRRNAQIVFKYANAIDCAYVEPKDAIPTPRQVDAMLYLAQNALRQR